MKTALLKVGHVSIHWYGVIIVVALIAGLLVAVGMAKLRRERVDPLAGILLLGLLTGMIGARVCYVAFTRGFYAPDPGRVFAVWEGGLALHGGLLGAMLATLIYTYSRELSFWTWADICAPGLILGQAIGRVGDVLNNQDFGKPSGSTWAATIPVENRPLAYQGYSHFTPTGVYEAGWDVLVFLLLLLFSFVQRRWSRVFPSGSIFLLYLMLYSLGRIPIERLRLDSLSLYLGNQRVAILASYAFIGAGLLLYVVRLLPKRQQLAPDVAVAPQLQPNQAYFIAASQSATTRPLANGYLAPTIVLPALSAPAQTTQLLEAPEGSVSSRIPTEEVG